MTSLADYPSLARLQLTEGEMTALAEQGSVYEEKHRGKTRHKLRFRTSDARQIVRYVPIHLGDLVRVDLERLQTNRHAASALREATRRIRQARRDAKRQLQPVLDELGYHFHGSWIRRRRHKQFEVRSRLIDQTKELNYGRF